jgi:hypothetical protein
MVGRRRGITIYDKEYIIEYDALKTENQLSIFRLLDQNVEIKNYNDPPLLKLLIEYFLLSIENKADNFIDYKFMIKVMQLKNQLTLNNGV